MSIKKTIFTGFAPNLTAVDFKKACSWLFIPWRWVRIRKGNASDMVEDQLKKYFQINHAFAFDSGRSALFFALKSLNLPPGSEVLVQSYTCVVVINAILWNGLKPVYVDIENDLNMDIDNLKSKITFQAKAIIIQHTFGKPATIDKIIPIAKDKGLFIIEDCAHSFGISYQNKLLGSWGDLAILSFGSDKCISCVRGGAILTNNEFLAKKISKFQGGLKLPTLTKTFQHLWHYPIFYLGKKIYHLKIGKIILVLAKKIHLTNRIIYKNEKRCLPVTFYPSILANSLALLLLQQFTRISEFNDHRLIISDYYFKHIKNSSITLPDDQQIPYLRLPIFVDNPGRLSSYMKANGVILGDWYNVVIAPKDVDINCTTYKKGDCLKAEDYASRSVNLPTDINVSLEDAKRIAVLLNRYGN